MSLSPKLLDSTTVYRDDLLGLRLDVVEIAPDRAPVKRRVLEYRPACVLVPLDESRSRVLLTRQHRYPVGRDLWELPGGMMEDGESPEESAVRELEEETGHQVVGAVTPLLSFYPEPAFADHRIHVLAAVISEHPQGSSPQDPDVDKTAWISLTSALSQITDGDISSSWSIIGLLSVTRLLQEGRF
jgi:8-oxo-dGTP pyrophosphatase MutT (NUDIX family)